MKLVILFAVAIGAFAQSLPSPGSLYLASGRLGDATRDIRAGSVDDLITIVVSESLSAVASGVTNTSRKSSATSNITALAGTSVPARLANPLGVNGNQQLQGQGQTTRNMTLSTTIAARVIGVTQNGTLLVEGTKDISVNSEKQSITVRGLVRPTDLSVANSISSTQVADLTIHVNGKGVVGDAIRRPNFLYRLLLGLLPF